MTKFKRGKQKEPERKQIGVLINSTLWTEIKILALKEGRAAGELLEDAMRLYLKTKADGR